MHCSKRSRWSGAQPSRCGTGPTTHGSRPGTTLATTTWMIGPSCPLFLTPTWSSPTVHSAKPFARRTACWPMAISSAVEITRTCLSPVAGLTTHPTAVTDTASASTSHHGRSVFMAVPFHYLIPTPPGRAPARRSRYGRPQPPARPETPTVVSLPPLRGLCTAGFFAPVRPFRP